MKITFERNPERVELIKSMASDNKVVAEQARETFAALISFIAEKVLNQKATVNAIYRDLPFNENDRPSIPVDIFLGAAENYVRIWSQTMPGGLPTNHIQGLNEFTFNVYELDSAVSFNKSYLKQARLDVLTMAIERMVNEIAVKQERNGWSPILGALATDTTNGQSHVIDATQAGRFLVHDLNRLWTKIARMYTSYVDGTPDGGVPTGLTDLFISPEVYEDVRAFAYNPVNTVGGIDSTGTESADPNIALPDGVRENIFRSGGLAEIYNVVLHPMVEFGKNQKYNTLFDNFYQGSFDPTTQEVAVGLDLSRNVFLRPVVLNDDQQTLDARNGTVVIRPDDQFTTRSEKVGWFAKIKESRLVLDSRAITGIII